jgi:hypothetical protein
MSFCFSLAKQNYSTFTNSLQPNQTILSLQSESNLVQVRRRNAKLAAAQVAADQERVAATASALAAAQSIALSAITEFIRTSPDPASLAPNLATFVAGQKAEADRSSSEQLAVSTKNQEALRLSNQADQVSLIRHQKVVIHLKLT